jgi:hypothetical protein
MVVNFRRYLAIVDGLPVLDRTSKELECGRCPDGGRP